MSNLFFEIISQSNINVFTPIDEDDNTILHYISKQFEKTFHSNILNYVRLADWKRVKNKEERTPYDLVIAHDTQFDFGCLITMADELRAYVADYTAIHGDEGFKKAGGKLIFTALTEVARFNLSLARFLVEEKGVSLTRIIAGEEVGKRILEKTSYRDNVLLFVLERGYQIDLKAFQRIMNYCLLGALKVFLEKCIDIVPFVNFFCSQNNFLFDQTYKTFVKHQKVIDATADGRNLLEIYFFSLCNTIEKCHFS